jgi:glycosyltransferase involved in cell wall biosynthesis
VGLVTDYSPLGLRDAILRVLDDNEFKKRIRIEGRKLIKEKFNWHNIVDDVEALYKEILRKNE